jgi:hypothetical protein
LHESIQLHPPQNNQQRDCACDHYLYTVKGNWRLDNSIPSKIIAMAFSMAAEIERDLTASGQKRHWQTASQREK